MTSNALLTLIVFGLAGLVLLGLILLACLQQVIFKMGFRNITRRPTQTVLIVIGLMLSSVLITTSFGLGDSVGYSLINDQLPRIGNIDEGISKASANGRNLAPFFSSSEAQDISQALQANTQIQASSGIIITPPQSIAVYDTTTKSIVAENYLIAANDDISNVWGTLQDANNSTLHISDLSSQEVYISPSLAQGLNAKTGDSVRVFINNAPVDLTVKAILKTDIDPGSFGKTMIILPLFNVQTLMNAPNQVNMYVIRNKGQGGTDNLGPNNSVSDSITKDLNKKFPQDFVAKFKADAVKNARSTSSTTTNVINAVGALLIIAGMLLIYLIFVLLAGERRGELGVSRAVGMKRGHLVSVFMFEGMTYSLFSTLLGIPIGIGVTALLVLFIRNSGATNIVTSFSFDLTFSIQWTSMVNAFCINVLLTFIVVVLSSYRISRMNIVAAIRDIEEGAHQDHSFAGELRLALAGFSRARRYLANGHPFRFLSTFLSTLLATLMRSLLGLCTRGIVILIAGVILLAVGIHTEMLFTYSLGVSFCIVGICLLLRWNLHEAGVRADLVNRISFTLLGMLILLYWSQPFGPFEKLIGIYDWLNMANYQTGAQVFFLSIVFSVPAAIWLVMYNGDLLIQFFMLVFGRFGRTLSVLRTGMAYPLNFKVRTGLTVAMFSLVTFVIILVVMLSSIFGQNAQIDQWTGGWQLQSDSPNLPSDLVNQVQADPTFSKEVDAIAALNEQVSRVHQVVSGHSTPTIAALARAGDDTFLTKTLMHLQSHAAGYTTDRQVWDAVRDHQGYGVIFNNPASSLIGIGEGFQPFDVTVQSDASPGTTSTVKVIGVLPTASQWPGLFISMRTGSQIFTDQHLIRLYILRVKPGVSDQKVSQDMSAAYGSQYGIQVELNSGNLDNEILLMNSLSSFLTGYLALGLIIGIAGLGVISSRSVVERRQQIGMMRSIGYTKRLIQNAFLLESSFVALLGLFIGTILGIWASFQAANAFFPSNNVSGSFSQFPIQQLVLVVVVSYLATLLTTYVPARSASRILPAEALRYE